MHPSIKYLSFSHMRERARVDNYRCTLCGAEFKAEQSSNNEIGLSRTCECIKSDKRRKKAEAGLEPIGSTLIHYVGRKTVGGKPQFVFLFQCDECGAEFEAYGRKGPKWTTNLSKKCKCKFQRRDNKSSLVSQEWAKMGQAPRPAGLKKIASLTSQEYWATRKKDPYRGRDTCLNCIKFETGACPVNPSELARIDTRKYSCDQFSFI